MYVIQALKMKLKYKYIHFEFLESRNGKGCWVCRNNRSKSELGQVEWYPLWREYVYEPTVQAVYSISCFEDINNFMRQLPV